MTYQWNGVKKVSLLQAINYFNDKKKIYLVNKDNTKTVAETIDEIYKHFGEYEVEL